jgi:hypothetical protein
MHLFMGTIAEFAASQKKIKVNGRLMVPNKPYPSSNPKKKRMVLVVRKGRRKLLHYGAKGYKHNYSPKAKRNYLNRSGGIRNKSGQLTKDDPFSPNYWARRDLWPRGKANGRSKYSTRG